tara:strand:- start:10 stop:264 length:255 start_codon:yes stop_codon:yes gene_type:complete
MRKLTKEILAQMIAEEKVKLNEERSLEKVAAQVPEVDASQFGGHLVHKIDYIKALKIKEAKLQRSLERIQEESARVKKVLMEEL